MVVLEILGIILAALIARAWLQEREREARRKTLIEWHTRKERS